MASDVREIRILTVDDHALLRKGIAVLLNAEPDRVAQCSQARDHRLRRAQVRTPVQGAGQGRPADRGA